MTSQLETELRAALKERADHVPADAGARLRAIDYHPHTRTLRRPLAFTGLVGTAGAASVLVTLVGGASNAFAGWTPTPTLPSPGQVSNALSDCQQQAPFPGLPLKLTDTRGPFTFAIFANDETNVVCINGSSFTQVSGASASAPVNVPADRVQLSTDHRVTQGGDAYSFAEGRTGADVSAVSITLGDGSQVQATVQNGWFVAWWPSAQEVLSATLSTSSGTETQTFRMPGSPCAPKLCTSGEQSGTSTGAVTGFSAGSGGAGPGGGAASTTESMTSVSSK